METKNNKVKSNTWMYIIAVVLMGLFIFISVFIIEKPKEIINGSTLTCIAEKSVLYVSTGCGYYDKQKQLLGEDLTIFNIIDCRDNPEACFNINVVPTWIINNETYEGYRTIENLKEVSGC